MTRNRDNKESCWCECRIPCSPHMTIETAGTTNTALHLPTTPVGGIHMLYSTEQGDRCEPTATVSGGLTDVRTAKNIKPTRTTLHTMLNQLFMLAWTATKCEALHGQNHQAADGSCLCIGKQPNDIAANLCKPYRLSAAQACVKKRAYQ